jgi:predicted N-acetyltransferase YhbS
MGFMRIRQITADERLDTMFPLQTYAFMPSPWADGDREAYARRMQYYRTSVSLVAEEDGQALACVSAFPMRQNVRGVVREMAGVASVATHPDARRRGFVRALLTRLLHEMRERGCDVSTLYPFRSSFYAQFGYVGLPRFRTATFAPDGLSHLLRADLPGEVERLSMQDAFAEFNALTVRLLGERHGFSVFDEVRTAEFRESPPRWVALARAGGEVVGAVAYRIERFGGDLVADDLLTTGPLGRALLLQFFARHVDQVGRVVVTIDTQEVPELWGTDFPVLTQARVEHPSRNGPMARLLSMASLAGTATEGDGSVVVEVVDDEWIGGRYRITGDGGKIDVQESAEAPTATLTCAGISALGYGVLDPVEVVTRGFGQVDPSAVGPLGALFPKRMPYLFADF